VESLQSGAVVLDVVACPAGAERVTLGCQLADEVGQALVVGVVAGLDAQSGGGSSATFSQSRKKGCW
jgi:hypothetical protein